MLRPSSPDALLGFSDCNDGCTRPVFLDSNGDQYLLHEDRGRVYGGDGNVAPLPDRGRLGV
jgi:hypothetical protein